MQNVLVIETRIGILFSEIWCLLGYFQHLKYKQIIFKSSKYDVALKTFYLNVVFEVKIFFT